MRDDPIEQTYALKHDFERRMAFGDASMANDRWPQTRHFQRIIGSLMGMPGSPPTNLRARAPYKHERLSQQSSLQSAKHGGENDVQQQRSPAAPPIP